MRKSLIALALVMVTTAAVAQERSFSVTMSESRWNTLARIISSANKPTNWTLEETFPIYTDINSQIGGQLNQMGEAQRKSSAELETLKAEVQRLTDELKKAKEPQP